MASVTTDQRLGVNASMAVKVPCVACTAGGNITLSGEQTIDGVSVVTDDRVLVTAQTDASENGIYDADTGAWTRSPDWDGSSDITTGTSTYVSGGTNYFGEWVVTTTGAITVGTTNVAIALKSLPSDNTKTVATIAALSALGIVTGKHRC